MGSRSRRDGARIGPGVPHRPGLSSGPAQRGSIGSTHTAGPGRTSTQPVRSGNTGSRHRGGRCVGMSAVAIIWIGVAAVCWGLCIYGINRAIRRSKERQEGRTPALTRH
jgi:hypothetical protein